MELSDLKLEHSLENKDKILSLENSIKEKLLFDLLEEISNDKNSSSYRECVTLKMMGFTQSEKKLGYDTEELPIEVKPKNITRLSKNKFDGSGNFSDFTWARHKKYSSDDVTMIVSGFYEGKILFLISFLYNSPEFVENIEKKLKTQLPNGDIKNRYVRSLQFTYKNYQNSDSFKIEYLSPNISLYNEKFNKLFIKLLIDNGSKK